MEMNGTIKKLMSKELSVDIIIPTYKPGEKFDELINRIQKQTIRPKRIYVINTEEKYFDSSKYKDITNMRVIHISKEIFDHGGTRNFAAGLSDADFIMFMTDDAVPVDPYLIEKLAEPFADENIAVSYGRQMANKKAGEVEKYTRTFNYPSKSMVKTKADLDRLGIKTYFCSNVCAMYRRNIYNEMDGFVTKTIFNEDMIMAAKIINQGYSIAYAAGAKVIHSHKYTYWQQFTRNFDLAVSQKQYSHIFGNVKSESEGIRLVKDTIRHLRDVKKAYLIPDLILQSGFKYMGYKAGSNYKRLPKSLIVKFSMNKEYWKENEENEH